jgi:hypothetical protein
VSDTVVKFEPQVVGEGFRFDPDELLERAKGQGFTNLVIIGELPEGEELWLSGMANAGETMILIERAKMQVIGR